MMIALIRGVAQLGEQSRYSERSMVRVHPSQAVVSSHVKPERYSYPESNVYWCVGRKPWAKVQPMLYTKATYGVVNESPSCW